MLDVEVIDMCGSICVRVSVGYTNNSLQDVVKCGTSIVFVEKR